MKTSKKHLRKSREQLTKDVLLQYSLAHWKQNVTDDLGVLHNRSLLTLLGFVPASIHVSQSDVGVAEALHPSDQPASLIPDYRNDLLSHI